MISNDLQSRISKVFLDHYLEQFFLTVGQNNFGNKIPKISRGNRKEIQVPIWSYDCEKVSLLLPFFTRFLIMLTNKNIYPNY